MRPWCLNSADNGKWQVSPLEAAQQEVLLHLLPPNTVSWWHPGNPESFWAARWTPDGSFFFFFCLQQDVLNPHKTELQPGLLVTQQVDGQPRGTHVVFSLWE